MKIIVSILSLALALVALGLYFSVRKYLKRHAEEELAQHQAWMMGRMRLIAVLTIAASLLSLLRLFL